MQNSIFVVLSVVCINDTFPRDILYVQEIAKGIYNCLKGEKFLYQNHFLTRRPPLPMHNDPSLVKIHFFFIALQCLQHY